MGDVLLKKTTGILLPTTKEEIRRYIKKVEDHIGALPQVRGNLKHHFSHDCYARELTLPEDCYFVGKIHKYRALNIITKGRLSVMSPDMDGVRELKAGDMWVSEPGAKRLVYTHEESCWVNVHGTTETDIEKIEAYYVTTDYDEVKEIE